MIPELNQTRADHIAALTVPCTYCNTPTGQPCHNEITKQPLKHFAAHQKRINDSKHPPPPIDDDEVPF